MATPWRHFENRNNSCAIDSFLELAQFSFYNDLSTINKGPFLTHIYDACRSREHNVELPLRAVREPSWVWLQSNASTFAGCTNGASFEQILDFISTNKDEEKLFTTFANWQYVCTSCNDKTIERKQNLPLYISNDDVLMDCDNDLEQTVNKVLYHPKERLKTCMRCNEKRRLLRSANVELSKYIFIRIPTLVTNVGEPKVLEGIKVKEEIILNDEYVYKLCGAVKGTHEHFSVTIAYDDVFCHVDDVSLNVRSAKSLSVLTNQGDVIYKTKKDDGYFLFVFKSSGRVENQTEEISNESPSFSTPVKQFVYPVVEGKSDVDDVSQSSSAINSEENVAISKVDIITEEVYKCDVQNSFEMLSDEVNCFLTNSCVDSNEEEVTETTSADKLHSTPKKRTSFSSSPHSSTTDLNSPQYINKRAKRDFFTEEIEIPISPIKPPKELKSKISVQSHEALSSCYSQDVSQKNVVDQHSASSSLPSGSYSTDSTCVNGKEWAVLFPEITHLHGRPFVSLRYLLSALSTENTRMNLSRLKSKHAQLNLDNTAEFYPEQTPKFVSLEAFLFHIFKSGSTCSVKKIQAHLFSLLQTRFQTGLKFFAGFDLFSDLDENGGIFMRLEDCYSLCGILGGKKRHRFLQKAAKFLGLSSETQFFSQKPAHQCTHVNINTVIGYLFIGVGSKRYREVSTEMKSAIDSVIHELLNLVTELPPIFSVDHISYLSVLDEVSINNDMGKTGYSLQAPTLHPEKPSSSFLASTNTECNQTSEHEKDTTAQYNRTMARRAKKLQESFSNISREIYKGGKESFKEGLLYNIQHFSDNNSASSCDDKNWSGMLTCEDLIDILDRVHTVPETSYLEQHIDKRISELYHIDARSIINMVDNCSSQNIINHLRKVIPGVLSSRNEIKEELSRLEEEFKIMLKPTRTSTGYRVDPERLLKCLRFLYYFVPRNNQLWKIWGDARETGGKKCCNITLSPLNNEMKLHNIKFHSPKDIWPICLFYGNDGRWNLEGNIGGEAGQPGWLDAWIRSEQQSETVKFFLTGDSMFLDAVHGKRGELAPNSKTGFNLYSTDSIEDKYRTGTKTGFRSELRKGINRIVPNSLLSSIPLSRTVFCLDHATTRIVEKLVQLRVKSIVSLGYSSVKSGQCKQEIEIRLGQFKKNMIDRMVYKADRLDINPDGSLAEKLTLNKRDAHALLLEYNPDYGVHKPLLEGVALTSLMFDIDHNTQEALQWPQSVSEYDLETAMWTNLSKAVFMLRNSDPDPVIKTGCHSGSLNANDYLWGLQDEDVQALIKHLDIFHKLFVIRYGGNILTPYMLKLIDFTSVFLHILPIKSLMRFSTEGGEHLHYEDNCYFFQHTQRGGSYRTRDPIYTILLHRYRVLQNRLLEYSRDDCEEKAAAGRAFFKWVNQEVLSSSANQNPDVPQAHANALPLPPVYNFILVGRVPASVMKVLNCKTKDEFSDIVEQHKSRVVNVVPSQLPKCHESIQFVVFAQQALCESKKPPEALLLACKRKWPVVSYLFCPEYVINPFTNFDKFRLDLTLLQQHCRIQSNVQAKEGKDYFFKERGPIHPVTQYKKQSKMPKQKTPKKSMKGPGSGYARFVEQEIKQVQLDKPGASWKDINREIAERWKSLNENEKKEFNNCAKLIFERCQEHSDSKQTPHIPAYK